MNGQGQRDRGAKQAGRKKKASLTPLNLSSLDGPEDQLHRSTRALLDAVLLPPAFWTTFPSGMYVLPQHVGGRLKAYGLKPGVPDIYILHAGRSIWLELKRRRGTVSKVQKDMHLVLENAGSAVYVCRSLEAVVGALVREDCPINEGVVRSLLQGPYERPERQCQGDLYYGQTTPHPPAESGGTTQPEKSAAA